MPSQKTAPKHLKVHFLTGRGEPGSAQGRDWDWPHKPHCPWAPPCRANTQPQAGTRQGQLGMGMPILAGVQVMLLDGQHWLLNEGRNALQFREFGPSASEIHPTPLLGSVEEQGSFWCPLAWEGREAVQHRDFRTRELSPLNTLTNTYFEPRLLRLSWSRADWLPPATPLTNFQQILSNGATWTQSLTRAKTCRRYSYRPQPGFLHRWWKYIKKAVSTVFF